MLKNDLLLKVAAGQNVERPPVWLMRQAGRILPQYRAIRNKLSGFRELCMTPHLAAEVTIQPVDELNVDAAIIFSDILVIAEAMGLPFDVIEKTGPVFPWSVSGESDFQKLHLADPGDSLSYVTDAIGLVKKELAGRVPLIGFAGAPWTLFCYMAEGKGSKTFSKAKSLLFREEKFAHRFLELITESTILYLKAQVRAGADLIQIFDSWAGLLGPEHFRRFSLPYIKRICEALPEVPVTVFARGAWFNLADLNQLPCQVIGLDWTIAPEEARKIVSAPKALQGNLDPCVLYAKPEDIQAETAAMLQSFGNSHHIVNLGHGVYPDTPLDNVKVFVDAVKNYRYAKNA